MKKLVILLGVLAFLMCGTSAWADLSGGSITNSTAGITDTQAFSNTGFTLAWSITENSSTDIWTYDYEWSPLNSDKHSPEVFIIGVAPSATISNVSAYSGANQTGTALTVSYNATPTTINYTWYNGPSNTLPMLTTFPSGIEISIGGSGAGGSTLSLEFNSATGPQYGDFFAWGGPTNNGNLAAYSTGSALNSIFPVVGTSPASTVVPIPPSVFLLAGGLGGLGLIGRKRTKG